MVLGNPWMWHEIRKIERVEPHQSRLPIGWYCTGLFVCEWEDFFVRGKQFNIVLSKKIFTMYGGC